MDLKNRCYLCEYNETCELAFIVNFCDDCIDCDICDIKSCTGCEMGYDIECNNGFESEEDYND